jgi:hypothetical protein
MSRPFVALAAVGVLFLLTSSSTGADDEMVANPFYKFWAGAKVGSTAVHLERTKLSGAEGKVVPEGVDEKRIAYKLLEVNDRHVVVEMVVTEEELLGYVQAAPTKYIYPAKLKKSHLERIIQESSKGGEETVKVGDKEYKCKTATGTVKEPNGEVVDYKMWLSDDVPGSIVKQVRTAKQKGDVIAETTITLESYKKAS